MDLSGHMRANSRPTLRDGRTGSSCSVTRSTRTRCRRRLLPSSRRGGISRSRQARRSQTSRSTRYLYRESWSDPDIRWLLSTVPTTMIFDDHDVNDDWNISSVVGRGDARAPLVGGPNNRGVHVILALPASRQPVTARARRRRAIPPRPRGRATQARDSARSRSAATANRPQAAGRITATSAKHASS